MDLADLQREAHAIAKTRGDWDTERTFGDLIAGLHLGLSKALEAHREDGLEEWIRPSVEREVGEDGVTQVHTRQKPVGVAFELAGLVIRVADMAEHYDWDLSGWQGEPEPLPMINPTFGDWISFMHAGLSLAFASLCTTLERDEWVEPLKALLRGITAMAAHYGIDLDAAIAAKLEYIRTRTYRHGGEAL